MSMKMVDAYSGFSIDFSRMNFDWAALDALHEKFSRATREMIALESSAIKNPDENRKVTHFTDRVNYRTSGLFNEVEEFAAAVRNGDITGGTGKRFDAVVVNGIGGSALGPQLMQFAMNGPYWNELSDSKRRNYLKIYFLDNTDAAEMTDLFAVMDPEETLHVVISKSGGTQETKNNLIAMENFYAQNSLPFAARPAAKAGSVYLKWLNPSAAVPAKPVLWGISPPH